MKTVVLRLKGLQSWGDSSKEVYRETLDYPTFSGVIGLISSALGVRSFEEKAKDLRSLKMAIRFNNYEYDNGSGTKKYVYSRKECDYQTANGFRNLANKNTLKDSVQTWRRYLSDADFFVALTGEDSLVEEVAVALKSPKYHLFLGRLAFAPTTPVLTSVSNHENPLDALKEVKGNTGMIRFVVESTEKNISSERVRDMPVDNTYKYRTVNSIWINVGE